MTSIIEAQRLSHTELEKLEDALCSLLMLPSFNFSPSTSSAKPPTQKERLTNEHRARNLIDRIVEKSRELWDIYKDDIGLRKEEMQRLNVHEAKGPGGEAGIATFYGRLANIKKLDQQAQSLGGTNQRGVDEVQVDFAALEGEDVGDGRDFVERMFTGEESIGRFLDLIQLHVEYNNLGGKIKRIGYLQYLDDFDKFERIERAGKGDAYARYLRNLKSYLESFVRRAFPLRDVEADIAEAEDEFADLWEKGEVEGWPKLEDLTKGKDAGGEGIWCPACARSYAKQTVYDAHLSSKKHKKAAEKLTDSTNAQPNGHATEGHEAAIKSGSPAPSALTAARQAKDRQTALLEHVIRRLASHPSSPLVTIQADTKSNVERKQTLTDRERQQEIEEMEERADREARQAAAIASAAEKGGAAGAGGVGEDEEDEEGRIYNPLKLPLGWDGKPIPYWLYKLHGLGVEYKCEICSNTTYMGRKNFERHFQEQRHTFGMKALGLPNTKHFHEITRIEDAIALAEKLKAEGKQEVYKHEEMEELEDDEGNVYSYKMYHDLKRQGLI